MSETKTTYLLWSMLTGTISFFASAVITSMVLLPLDFAIIDTIHAGGIGGLFLGLFHMNHHKIQKMGLAGLVAVPIGFWGAFILAGGADLIFSAINVNTENPNIYNIGGCGRFPGPIMQSIQDYVYTPAGSSRRGIT